MNAFKAFFVALIVILVADGVWLGYLMSSFYKSELGTLARRNGESLSPRLPAALLVYLLIPGGIALFVRPLLGVDARWTDALGWGALYGLIIYGVYDLTNRAILAQWSLRLTLIDIAWGSSLCALASLIMWATCER